MAKVKGGTAPILLDGLSVYSNPLPHVLILTAIVVGVATTALGLSFVVRIRDAFGGAVDWRAEAETIEVSSASELRRHFGLNIAFSPGYGAIEAS